MTIYFFVTEAQLGDNHMTGRELGRPAGSLGKDIDLTMYLMPAAIAALKSEQKAWYSHYQLKDILEGIANVANSEILYRPVYIDGDYSNAPDGYVWKSDPFWAHPYNGPSVIENDPKAEAEWFARIAAKDSADKAITDAVLAEEAAIKSAEEALKDVIQAVEASGLFPKPGNYNGSIYVAVHKHRDGKWLFQAKSVEEFQSKLAKI